MISINYYYMYRCMPHATCKCTHIYIYSELTDDVVINSVRILNRAPFFIELRHRHIVIDIVVSHLTPSSTVVDWMQCQAVHDRRNVWSAFARANKRTAKYSLQSTQMHTLTSMDTALVHSHSLNEGPAYKYVYGYVGTKGDAMQARTKIIKLK